MYCVASCCIVVCNVFIISSRLSRNWHLAGIRLLASGWHLAGLLFCRSICLFRWISQIWSAFGRHLAWFEKGCTRHYRLGTLLVGLGTCGSVAGDGSGSVWCGPDLQPTDTSALTVLMLMLMLRADRFLRFRIVKYVGDKFLRLCIVKYVIVGDAPLLCLVLREAGTRAFCWSRVGSAPFFPRS